MDKNRYVSHLSRRLLPVLAIAAIFLAVLMFFLAGLESASSASGAEGLRIAEDSIRRAVINCYASEGKYPPDFNYIEEHYGIRVDESKYIVHYEIFASNIMPSITVIENER